MTPQAEAAAVWASVKSWLDAHGPGDPMPALDAFALRKRAAMVGGALEDADQEGFARIADSLEWVAPGPTGEDPAELEGDALEREILYRIDALLTAAVEEVEQLPLGPERFEALKSEIELEVLDAPEERQDAIREAFADELEALDPSTD